jgi:hypothetical protein
MASASSNTTGKANALTIDLLDSSDDDQDFIPPSSGLTFRRDEPEPEPTSSRPSHLPPARVSMSANKKARTSLDTNGTSTAYNGFAYRSGQKSTKHADTVLVASRSSAPVAYATRPPPSPPKKLDTVWLVYHQKEPYYHSAWSYDSNLRFGPSYIDKICVGVYDSKVLADVAAKYYWEKQVRKPVSSNDPDQVGPLGGYFYDGMDSGCVNTLSHRVCVEKQSMNPVRPTKTDHDKAILQRRGR